MTWFLRAFAFSLIFSRDIAEDSIALHAAAFSTGEDVIGKLVDRAGALPLHFKSHADLENVTVGKTAPGPLPQPGAPRLRPTVNTRPGAASRAPRPTTSSVDKSRMRTPRKTDLERMVEELRAEVSSSKATIQVLEERIRAVKAQEVHKAAAEAGLRTRPDMLKEAPLEPGITIRHAERADAQQISTLINVALMADDSFFTDPQNVNRVSIGETLAMMEKKENAAGTTVRFLVAEDVDVGALGHTLVGCVRVALPNLVSRRSSTRDALNSGRPAFHAELGMLAAVPGARGISTLMLQAAEKLLKEKTRATLDGMRWPHAQTLRIIVPVFNQRTELMRFYEDQGYKALRKVTGEPEIHPEFAKIAGLIVNEEWKDKVHLQILCKDIEIGRRKSAELDVEA